MGCDNSVQITGIAPANSKVQQNRHERRLNRNCQRKSIDVSDKIVECVDIVAPSLSETQLEFAVRTLSGHQLFSTLKKNQLKKVCSQMVSAVANPGKYVFKQGDPGACFFIIYQGSVDVQIDQEYVRTLTQGQTFGQLAMLFKTARTASIVCKQKSCSFLLMKPSLYKQTLQKMRMQEEKRNLETIQKVPLFSCLTNKQKFSLTSAIKEMKFTAGQSIFETGDDAQMMYIIGTGKVSISIEGKKQIQLGEGQLFGEASLQANMKRSGTAKAVSNVICSILSRKDIEHCLGSSIQSLLFYNTKKWSLLRSEVFKSLDHDDINKFVIEFQTFHLKDDEKIDRKKYTGFLIALEGSFNGVEGKVFNQKHWINQDFKCDDLVKHRDGNCCFLPFRKAKQIFDSIKSRDEIKQVEKAKVRKSKSHDKLSLNDFTYLKKLGEGQFGQVYLVKNAQYGNNLYALKCMSKEVIKKEDIEISVINERQILEKTIFPYIVGYVTSFQSRQHIFILMEYIHGKEMFDVIREVKTMNSEMVRYYFSCLMLCIEYLHLNNIVYRDLKPQNSVVDYRGRAYLIDMGTAKELKQEQFYKTFTIIGTPHYMAPQTFEGNGYSFEIDLWSLGCLLYQFLCYCVPFGENLSDPYAIFSAIKKSTLSFPHFMRDQKAKKLILGLLAKHPKQRGHMSFDKIKKCDYLKDVNWSGLMEQDSTGPYIPKSLRGNTLSELLKTTGRSFLQIFYKTEMPPKIEKWNATY